MARILVIYGTTDGQTAKIAAALGRDLRSHGQVADVIHAGNSTPGPSDYDGVIVAASVHAGGYQRDLRRWVRRHVADLSHTPNAFVSVCLGVLQHDPAVDCDLAAIRERFVVATGWRPMTTKVVAGALPYTHYNWAKRLVLKRIVQKAGGDTDTSRDYEYTDWDDLRTFARTFAATVERCLERLSEPSRFAGVGAA
jgi:menaquinone-dependent protoporphyrinogen oxidase